MSLTSFRTTEFKGRECKGSREASWETHVVLSFLMSVVLIRGFGDKDQSMDRGYIIEVNSATLVDGLETEEIAGLGGTTKEE